MGQAPARRTHGAQEASGQVSTGVSGRGAAGLRGGEEGGGSGALGALHREAHFWEQEAVTSNYSLRPEPALFNDIQEGSSNLSP